MVPRFFIWPPTELQDALFHQKKLFIDLYTLPSPRWITNCTWFDLLHKIASWGSQLIAAPTATTWISYSFPRWGYFYKELSPFPLIGHHCWSNLYRSSKLLPSRSVHVDTQLQWMIHLEQDYRECRRYIGQAHVFRRTSSPWPMFLSLLRWAPSNNVPRYCLVNLSHIGAQLTSQYTPPDGTLDALPDQALCRTRWGERSVAPQPVSRPIRKARQYILGR